MTRITELEQEIRELINAPRKHRAILEDSAEYHKLCSCLDVIGDTELAFRAHEEMSDDPRPGSSYLLVYGFLQALVLQQDAVRYLYEALGLPSEPDPVLPLFAVGDMYVSLCKRSAYAPFSAQRRSRALFWL